MTASRLNSSAAAASSRSYSVRGPTKGAREPGRTSTHARAIRAGGTPTQQFHTPPATSGTRELLLRESGSLDFGNRLHPDAAGPCQNSDPVRLTGRNQLAFDIESREIVDRLFVACQSDVRPPRCHEHGVTRECSSTTTRSRFELTIVDLPSWRSTTKS